MDQAKYITSCNLDKYERGKPIEQRMYQGMISSFLYLVTSHPNIMFDVCFCAFFKTNPKESHPNTVKRIMRYLSSTSLMDLWYPKKSYPNNFPPKSTFIWFMFPSNLHIYSSIHQSLGYHAFIE